MITMKTIMDWLDKKEIAQAMIELLTVHSEDFREDQRRCDMAIAKLTEELQDNVTLSVQDEMEAIHRQLASNMLFSGFLGFQANLDHYMNPAARTFLEVDCEVYLRENTAKRLPEYADAQHIRGKFYAFLSSTQRDIYEDIAMYASHLETVAPKLSHLLGYIMGNLLLPHTVPGYYPDNKLTAQYLSRMEELLGLPMDDLLGWRIGEMGV